MALRVLKMFLNQFYLNPTPLKKIVPTKWNDFKVFEYGKTHVQYRPLYKETAYKELPAIRN